MQVSKSFKQLVLLQLVIPVVLLAIAVYKGLSGVMYKAGFLQDKMQSLPNRLYALTGKSMLYALALTGFFTIALGQALIAFYYRQEPDKKVSWSGCILMMTGLLLFLSTGYVAGPEPVALPEPHPLFYTGVVIFIIGSWTSLLGWLSLHRQWKKNNPATVIPLAVSGLGVYAIIWTACSLMVTAEILLVLLPGSLGLLPSPNTGLLPTITGYFHYALSFCWIIPLYILLLTVLPVVAGGKLYSGLAGRMVLCSLLIISIPVVNQPSLPGILNYGIVITGLITVFILTLSLEYAGRKNGAKRNMFSWAERLPYFDEGRYLFAYLFCSLTLLATGSVSALSHIPLNDHTTWTTGSFHITVTGPVILSMGGMSLYLYSHLSGKKISWPKLNVTIPYLWVMGILLFSFGLNWGGLLGQPLYNYIGQHKPDALSFRTEWLQANTLTLLGGLILLVAGILFLLVFAGTMLSRKTATSLLFIPVSTSYYPEKPFFLFNRLSPLLLIAGILIAVNILPPLIGRSGSNEEQAMLFSDNGSIKLPAQPVVQEPAPPVKNDSGLLLGFLAAVGVFILILLFCVQASGLQRKLRSQKTSFPG